MRNIVAAFLVSALLNIIVLPLILMWSLNTLFALNLEFTVWNWLAAWAFLSCVRGAEVSLNKGM